MLTDGTAVSLEGDLLVTYTTPVSACTGLILDADCRTNGGPPCEQWTITALDGLANTLDTYVIDAPPGLPNPECDEPDAGPGDSLGFRWSFDLPGQQIAQVRIRYTGAASNVGLAFDDFSPSDLPPLDVDVKGPRVAICSGHRIELYADVAGGLPPYAVQWQEETAPGVWTDLSTERSEVVGPTAPTTYRALVTDDDGATAQDEVVVNVVTGPGPLVCDATLLVSSVLTDRILRYDPVTLTFVDTFVAAGAGGLDGPAQFRIDSNGSLLTNSQNRRRDSLFVPARLRRTTCGRDLLRRRDRRRLRRRGRLRGCRLRFGDVLCGGGLGADECAVAGHAAAGESRRRERPRVDVGFVVLSGGHRLRRLRRADRSAGEPHPDHLQHGRCDDVDCRGSRNRKPVLPGRSEQLGVRRFPRKTG